MTERRIAKILKDINNPKIKGFGDSKLNASFVAFLKGRGK